MRKKHNTNREKTKRKNRTKKIHSKQQKPNENSISYTAGINHRHTTEKYDGLAEKKSANSITSGLLFINEC